MKANDQLVQMLKSSIDKYGSLLAVKDSRSELTYSQLLVAVNECMNTLSNSGIKKGHVMLVCGDKSVEVLVVILACVFLGIIYVPLEGVIPKKRIKAIAQTTGAKACYCCEGGITHYQSESSLEQGTLIFYTSGSTGQPKAVLIPENNILSFVFWAKKHFNINSNDRLAAFAPWHFDLSILDIYAALFTGASIHCVPGRLKPFPSKISGWLDHQKITVVYMVPTALRHLIKHSQWASHEQTTLRCILFAGEPYPLSELKQLRDRFPLQIIANLYGPTETNVCAWHDIPSSTELSKWEHCPIGLPLPGFIFHIDGGDNEGELICVSDSISLGYLNDPASDNFFKSNNMSAYKTGDIVRLTDNGYVFLGRKDRQIKCFGYRIDPYEIEAILRQNANVFDAAVCLNQNRLVAFIVSEEADTTELLEHCAKQLPISICPRKYIFVHTLPKTQSDKVDYAMLLSKLETVT